MDTLPPRHQIPKCSEMLTRQENFGGKGGKKPNQNQTATAVFKVYLNEEKGKKMLRGMDFLFGREFSEPRKVEETRVENSAKSVCVCAS